MDLVIKNVFNTPTAIGDNYKINSITKMQEHLKFGETLI